MKKAVTLFLAILASTGCRTPPARLFAGMEVRTQLVMGTRLSIAVPRSLGKRTASVLRQAFDAVRRVDELLSDYRPESALSRLNQRAGKPAARIDPRLWAFLRRSLEDYRRTEGAFDVALGSLTHLFRQKRRISRAEWEAARQSAGSRHIALSRGKARLVRPGTRLDPGAIGKGYALDFAVEVLRKAGVRRAFITFGDSSFYGLGAPPGREGWPVLLKSTEPGRFLGILPLRDAALASSMSRRAPDPMGPGRRGHIVNPRTGRLIQQARFAAVVSPSATDADVLSTALIVAPERRARLAARYPTSLTVVQRAKQPPSFDPRLRRRLSPP